MIHFSAAFLHIIKKGNLKSSNIVEIFWMSFKFCFKYCWNIWIVMAQSVFDTFISDPHPISMRGNVNIGNWVLNWVLHFARSYTTHKKFTISTVFFFNMPKIRKRCFCGGIGVHNLFSGGDVVFFHFLCVCSCKGSSCLSSTKRRSTQTNWTKTRTLNKKNMHPQ